MTKWHIMCHFVIYLMKFKSSDVGTYGFSPD